MAFAAHVLETRVFPMARRGFRLIATVTDDDFAARRNTPKSLASLVFFSYRKSYVDWVQRKLHTGALLVVAGEPSVYDNRLQFTHPDLLTINPVQSQSENGEWNDCFGDPANPPLGNLAIHLFTHFRLIRSVFLCLFGGLIPNGFLIGFVQALIAFINHIAVFLVDFLCLQAVYCIAVSVKAFV